MNTLQNVRKRLLLMLKTVLRRLAIRPTFLSCLRFMGGVLIIYCGLALAGNCTRIVLPGEIGHFLAALCLIARLFVLTLSPLVFQICLLSYVIISWRSNDR